ncbi:P-loop containing nucleoside triphosphate hydrolase protein [Cylindrobasidium torrendii FP15055 ss-10]|uniref:Ribosome assembly protein 1 n=1 Tax=Cylindrobasidium torrendii FP15055 ss-10 TaxID=1314674 RepID=A0A0D7BQP5_9AGAR|nr:P-loop containing nucleoside triphosphate hydrolase protein [Cylindrobasidium torrendii FP15055 ss-10]
MDAESQNIRIITTLGHVDHGKTTLMDSLLAANNIISPRMAGKMRYLDSREDEQERGITMESSAVSLKFQVMSLEKKPVNYWINMVDTPGHVDFSGEVSTASRLCDGALVLVDVVEGVCTQTISVLRQAWKDRLKPILIVNKFDRLITELRLSPSEAYHHLSRLIEDVNAVMGSFFASERMEDDWRWQQERERRVAEKKEHNADEADATVNEEEEFQEKDDEDIYFAPEKGNVVFTSAIDGWGFRVSKFATLYATKLGIKEANLRRVLWGDYYLDPKTKRIISYKHLRGRSLKPLFVQFVLENIWAVYDAVALNPNPDKVAKITTALNLKILPRDLRSKDVKHLTTLIFSQWLSLSTSIIQAVLDVVPAPCAAQVTRIPKMLNPDLHESTVEPKSKAEQDLFSANDSADANICAYVSKMFAVQPGSLPENKKKVLTAEEMRARAKEAREARERAKDNPEPEQALEGLQISADDPERKEEAVEEKDDAEIVLGFARLYSGSLSVGSKIHCMLPKYNTALPSSHTKNAQFFKTATVEGLYVMMGKELVACDTVRAGNLFAIRGLEGLVWRSATLCAPGGVVEGAEVNQECLINLGHINRSVPPIVRVAVEAVVPADMYKVIHGLKLLVQSDPSLEMFQQQTGEHVIVGAGELHLERCLKDLRERFAKVELTASKPIVPFRETAIKGVDMAPVKTAGSARGTMNGVSAQNVVTFTVRAAPLPTDVREFLLNNLAILRKLERDQKDSNEDDDVDGESAMEMDGEIARQPTVTADKFWPALEDVLRKAGGEWAGISDQIWGFGPHRAGGCMLVDKRKGVSARSFKRRLEQDTPAEKRTIDFDNCVETGFELATFQGPLCAEPVSGLAYFLEELKVDQEALDKEIEQNRLPQITGSLIGAVRDAFRNGLLDWSPRLMLAMYTCDIQASTDVLGKVYSVVAKRRGRIVSEEMREGTSFFTVSALLPVVESFGFADDIRKKTSGAASPQLIFSGYEMLDQDPFWVPTTEEELEDLGEKADRANIAKAYMDAVRERKGLFVDRKIVEFAEKQRTLKR